MDTFGARDNFMSRRPEIRSMSSIQNLLRLTALIAVLAFATSCATPAKIAVPVDGHSATALDPASIQGKNRILIATTRERADLPSEMFSGERAQSLNFAAIDVSIPTSHKPGRVERPRRGAADPKRHIVAINPAILAGSDEFTTELKTAIASRSAGERDILVFVHGFNTSFDEGVYRFSQIVHDSGFTGVPVLFTWASRGNALDYFYDRDSATAARDGLETTLKIAAGTGAGRVHLMAHSMGNWVAMETLRQLRIGGDTNLGGKLGEVILASPDVDVDVFKSQMRRLGPPDKPYTMLVSSDDRALLLSERLAGNKPRLGNYVEDREIADLGITVINVTKVSADKGLKHSKFSKSPDIVRLIGLRLQAGDRLSGRRARFSDRIASVGQRIGGLAGSAADVVITVPETLLTRPDEVILAPIDLLSRRRN